VEKGPAGPEILFRAAGGTFENDVVEGHVEGPPAESRGRGAAVIVAGVGHKGWTLPGTWAFWPLGKPINFWWWSD